MKRHLSLVFIFVAASSMTCSDRLPTRPEPSRAQAPSLQSAGIAIPASRAKPRSVPPRGGTQQVFGLWGNDVAALAVDAGGGRIQYGCAHGVIDPPFAIGAQGQFDLRGTHVREHGGPAATDEEIDGHPARYVGRVEGNQMTLTVTETDTQQVVGTFVLTLGVYPRLANCV